MAAMRATILLNAVAFKLAPPQKSLLPLQSQLASVQVASLNQPVPPAELLGTDVPADTPPLTAKL